VVAAKPLVDGGVLVVMVSGSPPRSLTSKLIVAVDPTATSPKLSCVGAILICADGFADPDNGTPKSPTLVSSVTTPPYTWSKSPEEPGGEKSTAKLILAPGLIVALAGGFGTANGNAGGMKPVMVTALVETFVNVTDWLTIGPPIG
jgi:hypothetical protein